MDERNVNRTDMLRSLTHTHTHTDYMNNQNQNKCLVDFYGRTKFIRPIDFNCRIRWQFAHKQVGLFLCVQQAVCRQIQQCRTYYSLTHAKSVLVFSRAVDLLHIEWFSESPPRAHKRYRKSYGSQRKHTHTHEAAAVAADVQACMTE